MLEKLKFKLNWLHCDTIWYQIKDKV